MGRGKLTTEEQAILRTNPNVKLVNDQCIFYTAEFKKHFIEALTKGKRPKQIFVEAGFDLEILGDKRIERATAQWKERHIRNTILASIDREALYFIQKAFDHSGKYYHKGSRSLRMVLKNDYDIIYNRKKIQRIMRKYQLKCPVKQSRPYGKRKNDGIENKFVPNRVKRAFKPGKARKLFLTDIIYIKYRGHFSYVSVIIDAQTNEPVAYKTSTNYNLDFVLETLEQLKTCGYSQNAIIHSDQGVHYTAKKFRDTIQSMGLIQSMSRKGNCWDNAPCESFFGKMKQEVPFDENAATAKLKPPSPIT